jgi:hypothetical protein
MFVGASGKRNEFEGSVVIPDPEYTGTFQCENGLIQFQGSFSGKDHFQRVTPHFAALDLFSCSGIIREGFVKSGNNVQIIKIVVIFDDVL